MQHLFKSIFVTLMLTMPLTSIFGQKTIELTIGSDGKLKLSPSGTIELGTMFNRRVVWEIKDSRIKRFEIAAKPNQDYPFNVPLGGAHPDDRLELQVIFLRHWFNGTEWSYSINYWTGAPDDPQCCDPKIAVKPVKGLLESLIGFLVVLFTTFFAVRSFTQKRKLADSPTQNFK